MVSTMRLYGAAIALVSGLYSLWQSFTGPVMGLATWVMLVLGVLVIVHGLVLLTSFSDRLGGYSGPLMIVWAGLMLLNQAWFAVMGESMNGMGGQMSGGMRDGMAGSMLAGADGGMVALAVLMLASGLIMTTREEGMDGM